MPFFILVATITVIVAEIVVFVEVSKDIGTLTAILLCVLTTMLGMTVLRTQSGNTAAVIRERLEKNESLLEGIYDGFFMLLAGLLLLLPGFISDAAGLLLLLPPVRHLLYPDAPVVDGETGGKAKEGTRIFYTETRRKTRRAGPKQPPQTIDAEYKDITDDKDGKE
ncbi:MAG: FxsA family protein [Alphaproteobacteria bacterium]|nr:MAG: FxsA family protein [Alphaproteobacteria bacterium]